MINGLNDKEVILNKEKYGDNSLIEIKNNSFMRQFLISLSDPMIKILIIALGIKTMFLFKNFDWFETVGIVIAVVLGLLGFLIGTVKVPNTEKFKVTRAVGGENLDDIVLRFIKFKKKKNKIYITKEEEE